MINIAFIKKNKSFFKYLIVGSICLTIDYLVTLLILELAKNIFFANSIGYLLGTLSSYIGHTKFTFRKTSRGLLSYKQIIFYLLSCLCGITVGYLIIKFNLILGMDIIYAKLVQLLIVALVQYLVNSKITFKNKSNR